MRSLCNQLVLPRVICCTQTGFVFQAIRQKYTGTAVRIMAIPIPVSTGFTIAGRMRIIAVRSR